MVEKSTRLRNDRCRSVKSARRTALLTIWSNTYRGRAKTHSTVVGDQAHETAAGGRRNGRGTLGSMACVRHVVPRPAPSTSCEGQSVFPNRRGGASTRCAPGDGHRRCRPPLPPPPRPPCRRRRPPPPPGPAASRAACRAESHRGHPWAALALQCGSVLKRAVGRVRPTEASASFHGLDKARMGRRRAILFPRLPTVWLAGCSSISRSSCPRCNKDTPRPASASERAQGGWRDAAYDVARRRRGRSSSACRTLHAASKRALPSQTCGVRRHARHGPVATCNAPWLRSRLRCD